MMKVSIDNTHSFGLTHVGAMNAGREAARITGRKSQVRIVKFNSEHIEGTLFFTLAQRPEHSHDD